MEHFSLNDGNLIPALGFGTYKVQGFPGVQAITQAIENGYRLLDSAVRYENEGLWARQRNSSVAKASCSSLKLPGSKPRMSQRSTKLKKLASGLTITRI